ncbi:MAG: YqaJ viral recombinase family protein [Xanthomonadales bacterium]|nr:YqaJ viral recombinase family protein [Xanthomonadales bacterium]
MIRQTITPDNEAHWLALRREDLTSTDIAALFGLSPYKTAFELWHEKKSGARVEFVENARMKWGKRMESTVAQGIAEDQGWAVRPFKDYMRIEGLRVGSSFDFCIVGTGGFFAGSDNHPEPDAGDAILEIKCVDFLQFRDGWTIDEGFIEAPAHIELQAQHQMLVSGLKRAYIGVMVGGNDIRVIERAADPQVHAGILAAARDFWKSIDENNPPPPVMPDDAEAVIGMYQFAEPGRLLVAQDDAELLALVREYSEFKSVSNNAAEQAKVRQAEILQRIGDHEKVLLPGFNVSAGMIGPATVSYERAGYRNFRVTEKKPKP